MEKESYSIDDILSEVKKRREHENQQQANTEPQDKAEPEVQEKEEVKVTAYKAEPEVIEETSEKEEDFTINDTADIEIPTIEEEETQFTDTDQVDEQDGAVIDNQAANEENKQDKNGMVDLLSLAQNEEVIEPQQKKVQPKVKEKVKFSKTKKGKAIITIIIILLVMVIAGGVFAILYANNMLNKVTDDKSGAADYEMSTYYDGMDFLKEDFPTIKESSAGEVYSYPEYLKQWYQNGDPVSSTHVLNILLIGEDTREEKISDASRADSAIIVSVNVDTKEIQFCVTFMFTMRLTVKANMVKLTLPHQWAE